MNQRRSAWSALADEWDPDHPAVALGRAALTLEGPPQTAQDAPERPFQSEVASATTPEPQAAPDESRRGRIADLVARVQAGDLSAVELLRRLLDRG